MRKTETDKSLSGAWNASQETDGMFATLLRLVDYGLNRLSHNSNLMLGCLAMGYFTDG